MSPVKRILLTAILFLTSLSCANRWREAGGDINEDTLNSALSEISAGQAASVDGNLSTILAMKDQGAAIYFAEAPGSFGPVAAVLNVDDLSIFNAPASANYFNVTEARIFLFDLWTDSKRDVGLIVGIKMAGDQNFRYSSFLGTAGMNGGRYVATFSGNGATFTLQSYDVEEDDLAAVIQLRVYVGESYFGKISTLVGFGS